MRYLATATVMAAATLVSSGVNGAPLAAAGTSIAGDPTARVGVGPTPARPTRLGRGASLWDPRVGRDATRPYYLAPYYPPSEANRYY